MPTSTAKLLHLDLFARQCWHLALTATVTPSRSKVESLRNLAKTERRSDQWPWIFSDTYQIADEWYSADAMLHPSEEPGALVVHVDYSRGKGVRRRRASLLSLLEGLAGVDATADVACSAHFDFEANAGVSTISLPVPIPRAEGSIEGLPDAAGVGQRFQVRGLRMTLLDEEGSIDSSTVIDRPTNAEYHITVSFTRSSSISPELPGVLFNRASEISRGFFRIAERPLASKTTGEKEG